VRFGMGFSMGCDVILGKSVICSMFFMYRDICILVGNLFVDFLILDLPKAG